MTTDPNKELREGIVKMRVYTTAQNTDDGKHWLKDTDVDQILALISNYVEEKVREETDAIYDEYSFGGKNEFDFGNPIALTGP